MQRWFVLPKESGIKLVFFLRSKLGQVFSARQIKRAIERNLCLVNHSVETFASFTVQAGDRVIFHDQEMDALVRQPESKETHRILYEDEALLFYDKPAGITSDDKGLLAILNSVSLVHRLDRETTGVMVFAKTIEAEKHMLKLFKRRQVQKCYLALIDGIPSNQRGVIESYLERVDNSWKVARREEGKYARTDWRTVKQGQQCALLHCFPKTGRTHQIRLQMKEIGHPILGDYHYERNYRCRYHAKRCLLHAAEIAFFHPVTGEKVRVGAPIPRDFQQAMDALL
ncbi:MAG: RluA family pseudouridine synthase [Waddliaceae bacterium]